MDFCVVDRTRMLSSDYCVMLKQLFFVSPVGEQMMPCPVSVTTVTFTGHNFGHDGGPSSLESVDDSLVVQGEERLRLLEKQCKDLKVSEFVT